VSVFKGSSWRLAEDVELPKQVFRQQTVLNQFQAMGSQLKIQDGNIFQLPVGNINKTSSNPVIMGKMIRFTLRS
jgi:hypothetical protein